MSTFPHPDTRCDGITRRELLRAGGLAALGLTVTDWLRLRAAPPARDRAAACILVWLDGGPSHLDTFDPKPDAPSEVRGPFKTIATNVTGVRICEHLPRTAKLMDRIALIRSITSPLGEHNLGSHYLLTGYKPTPVLQYPSYGAVVVKVRGSDDALPPYIAVPDYNTMAGQGYLPGSCRPFAVGGDPSKPDFKVRDLSPHAGISTARLDRRQNFRQAFDGFRRQVEETGLGEGDAEFQQAYRLISSPKARQAFDLSREKREVRDRYGPRTIGQSCLLARRLVEAGVPFVTVTDRGWDTHDNLFNRLKEGYTGGTVGKVPTLDLAFSALLEDLSQRGLFNSTLVVLMGEFGRTPKLNTLGGRDHWPRVFSVALAGGGVRGGVVVGKSDARGEGPAERAVPPEDLARTIYRLLGIDARQEFHTADGRPVQVNQNGKVISELL
ncbi:MAG TPA: DUF1501 domain-containing protein [Gemmataceae bacterium]|nr:DUF1501 domain-containing protein [Gemmataceae bacterium]